MHTPLSACNQHPGNHPGFAARYADHHRLHAGAGGGIEADPRWAGQRDAIRADCLRQGWNEALGALTMEYGGTELDISTLRLALMDFLPAGDPRLAATLALSERTLDAGTGDRFYLQPPRRRS